MANKVRIIVEVEGVDDLGYFSNIANAEVETAESVKGISGLEVAIAVMISLASSATYDVLKASYLATAERISKYISAKRSGKTTTVIVNGVKYRIKSEEDMKSLPAAIEEASNESASPTDDDH